MIETVSKRWELDLLTSTNFIQKVPPPELVEVGYELDGKHDEKEVEVPVPKEPTPILNPINNFQARLKKGQKVIAPQPENEKSRGLDLNMS